MPVWAALDMAAIPAVAVAAKGAQNELDTPAGSRIPLLGVMGAFVFAAQMINFPVGLGTSGHLVGGALLAITVGPAAASVVMTAILILQAFIFQDGGIMALGANAFNMAIAGVVIGYLPYRIWGKNIRTRSLAIFLSGLVSVIVSGTLALAELLASGVPVSRHLLGLSAAVFVVSGLMEGAITATCVRSIEKLNPAWVRGVPAAGSRLTAGIGLASALLVLGGAAFASAAPDAVQNLAQRAGWTASPVWSSAPLAEYQWAIFGSDWARKASAGLAGLMIILAVCYVLGRVMTRQRSA